MARARVPGSCVPGWLAGWHGLILRCSKLPVSGSTEAANGGGGGGGGSVRQISLLARQRVVGSTGYGVRSLVQVELCDMAT